VYNPNYFPGKATLTIDQFVDYWTAITADPGLPVLGFVADPKTIIAIVDARRNNSGVVKTDGLDFNASYVIPSDWATFHLGAQANYTLHYRSAPVPGVPLTNEVNHFGYPARFTGRLEFGLEKGGFTASTYVNYVNSREITRAFLPAAIPDQYLKIGSYTTVDATLRYEFEDTSDILNGLALSVSALNLFDKDPPLVVNTGGSPIRFDPSYSSPLGRMVSFEISKKF
jgi:iron complex outermembrane receptor protein